jgi:hypothetical protein
MTFVNVFEMCLQLIDVHDNHVINEQAYRVRLSNFHSSCHLV